MPIVANSKTIFTKTPLKRKVFEFFQQKTWERSSGDTGHQTNAYQQKQKMREKNKNKTKLHFNPQKPTVFVILMNV